MRVVKEMAIGLTALAVVVAVSGRCRAQAWVPLKGEGSLSLSYTYFRSGDHLYSGSVDGQTTVGYTGQDNRWYLGDTYTHTLLASLDFSLTNRIALTTNLGFVAAKYEGRSPVVLAVDDGEYRRSLQDAGLRMRYLLVLRPVVVTPFLGYRFPTTDYPNNGHAARGLGLNEWSVGISVGRLLSSWASRAYVHSQYAYSVTEVVLDHRLRRSMVDLELGYRILDRFSFRVVGSFLHTAGGQDWLSIDSAVHGSGPKSLGTAFSASRYLRLGAGLGLSLMDRLGIYAMFLTTAWGENIEDGNYAVVGTSWRFSTPLSILWGR